MKHRRTSEGLLIDLFAALEDELFVCRLQSKQDVRQNAEKLRSFRRRLAILLHLKEHYFHRLFVTLAKNSHPLVLLLSLEEVEKGECEHKSRFLCHRSLDRLHQSLLYQSYIAVIGF